MGLNDLDMDRREMDGGKYGQSMPCGWRSAPIRERVDKILATVQKPTRYMGGEWNAPVRSWAEVKVRVALAYPDLYEVGQSHLGLRILYGLINETPGCLAERVYAPWPDMAAALRREELPLFSLETRRPIRDFDLLGFSLQYELTYTNILAMLSLAGMPLRAADRGTGDPLVIGGGPCAFNPEPLAPFFDAFFLGEAEEAIGRILSVLREADSNRPDRAELHRLLSEVPGVYVPSLYQVEYHSDGRIAAVVPEAGAAYPVLKRVVADFDAAYSPAGFVVPFQDIVHDRAMVEILRGCTHGCRFCQAGQVYRPVRERTAADIAERAAAVLAATGYEEVSLTSLSSTDHSCIEEIMSDLSGRFGPAGVNVSLPSLRADRFSVSLAERMQGNRKTSLTFAPEAGSERLRRVINKDLTDEDIMRTVEAAFAAGWQRLKLYFMIGLPTETDDDLRALAELVKRVLAVGRARSSRVKVVASLSTFVPKAHTPFQWRPQIPLEEIQRRQSLIRDLLRGRGLELQWHQAEQSVLEGIFARGDRRLSGLLEAAWRMGCQFDAWAEWFEPEKWRAAAVEAGIDAGFYTERARAYDEILPWDHLSAGVTKEYLQAEDERADQGLPTPDCRTGPCSACGVCPALGLAPPGGMRT